MLRLAAKNLIRQNLAKNGVFQNATIRTLNTTASRFPPKKKGKAMKGGKGGADKGGEFNSPTVTDPEQLQTVCVGLQLEEGAPEIALKPDDEYPDWLWEMSVEPKFLPEHFTPDTEDYYKALEKSNWALKSDRLKMRSYEHENKYSEFKNVISVGRKLVILHHFRH